MSGFLGSTDCLGFPVRSEAPNVLEYTAAEYWVREAYRRYFQSNGAVPQLTTWQLERFFTAYNTGDPVLELTMELLETDFHNLFTDAIIRRFNAMLKNGASNATLFDMLREVGQGGPRKPDMMGISANQVLLFDCLEVGTDKTADSTYKELGDKMKIVETAVVPQIKLRLPALATRHARGFTSISLPQDFVVRPSAFRLKSYEMILPLPVRVSTQGSQTTIDWICYHPTTNWKPDGAGPPVSGALPGTDGIVLYHIHRTPMPEVPKSIRNAIVKELNLWKEKNKYILELNPALIAAFGQNKSEWSSDAKLLFSVIGIAGLLLVIVAVGWEMGLFAGAASIASQGLAVVSSPAVLAAALRATDALTQAVWPVAVGAAPLIPSLQR